MARIIGIDLPNNKKIEVALTYIHGIGLATSKKILEETGIPAEKKTKDLDDHDITAITHTIQERYQVEGDLRRLTASNVKRLMSIGTYRGIRHKRSLPVRGQRTKTNARTRKGGKKTVGVFKDKTARSAVKPV